MRSTFAAASVLVLMLVPGAFGDGPASRGPLYTPVGIWSHLIDPKVKAELGITKAQDTGVQRCLKKWQEKDLSDAGTIYKMQRPNKEAKVNALLKQRADELFQSLGQVLTARRVSRLKQILLQKLGITLFDYPEIRAALKLSDDKVPLLKSIYEQEYNEIVKDTLAGRISQQEALKRRNALASGVSARVRAALTEDQRKTLQALLGAPYAVQ